MSSSLTTLCRRLTSAHSRRLIATSFLRRSHESSMAASPLRLITTPTTTKIPFRQFTATPIRRYPEKSDLGVPPPDLILNFSLPEIVYLGGSVLVAVGWFIQYFKVKKAEIEEHYAEVNEMISEENRELELQLRELQQSLLSIKRDLEELQHMNMQAEEQLKAVTQPVE